MRSTYTWAHKIKNNKSVNKTQYPPYGHVPHDLRFYKLSSSYVKLYLTSNAATYRFRDIRSQMAKISDLGIP